VDVEAKFAAFRHLHRRRGSFVIPNAWDAGTARILTALGFEALATTSAGYAFSAGKRDSLQSLNRDEVLDNARSIVAATDLPVSADLEDGFGQDPEHCADTIRLAADIGLVGGSIEDATGDPDAPIFDFDRAVERIAAAAQAARDLPFMLTARAENFLWGRPDLDETVARLSAFADAGADVVYAPGLRTLADIEHVCLSVHRPVNVVMGLTGLSTTVADLQKVGVKRISVGGSFARAAITGFLDAAREVRDHGTFTYSDRIISDRDAGAFMERHPR
jgi:2-methylisocitrate lyase-like PEP mutase family enzyme